MEVYLPQSLESQLNKLANRTGRGTDELVQEAIAQLLVSNALRNRIWVRAALVNIFRVVDGARNSP
jgi:hypothetical protein